MSFLTPYIVALACRSQPWHGLAHIIYLNQRLDYVIRAVTLSLVVKIPRIVGRCSLVKLSGTCSRTLSGSVRLRYLLVGSNYLMDSARRHLCSSPAFPCLGQPKNGIRLGGEIQLSAIGLAGLIAKSFRGERAGCRPPPHVDGTEKVPFYSPSLSRVSFNDVWVPLLQVARFAGPAMYCGEANRVLCLSH